MVENEDKSSIEKDRYTLDSCPSTINFAYLWDDRFTLVPRPYSRRANRKRLHNITNSNSKKLPTFVSYCFRIKMLLERRIFKKTMDVKGEIARNEVTVVFKKKPCVDTKWRENKNRIPQSQFKMTYLMHLLK